MERCFRYCLVQVWFILQALKSPLLTASVNGLVLEITGDSGYFLSPNYPAKYPSNQNLTYVAHLITPGPLYLRLELEVDLESAGSGCYDYVKVQASYICGTGSAIKDLRINGTEFVMIFFSDRANQMTGFNISFSILRVVTTLPPVTTTTEETFLQKTTTQASSPATTTTVQSPTTHPVTTPITAVDVATRAVSSEKSGTSSDTTTSSKKSGTSSYTTIAAVLTENSGTSSDVTTAVPVITTHGGTETTVASVVTAGSVQIVSQAVTAPVVRSTATPTPRVLSPWLESHCRCSCMLSTKHHDNITLAQFHKKISGLVKTLTMDKGNVSATKRRYVSVPDHRGSASALGILGIIMCVVPVLFVVGTDLIGAWQYWSLPSAHSSTT